MPNKSLISKPLRRKQIGAKRISENGDSSLVTGSAKPPKQKSADKFDLIHDALQKSINRLSASSDARSVIVEMMVFGSEVLSALNVLETGLIVFDEHTQSVRCKILIRSGKEAELAGTALDRDWPVDHPIMAVPWGRIRKEKFVWGLTSDESVLVAEVRAFHEESGARAVAYQALLRGETVIGWVGYSFKSDAKPNSEQIGLIQTLATHVSLAVEMEKLFLEARNTALAREREQVARQRAEEMERASLALQKTIDEVSRLQSLADFIPRALRIVAEAFGVSSAGFFEHPCETIYLRYWLFENKIYGPQELPGLDSTRYELMSQMAAGFTVPVDHLGVHYRDRSRPNIVHHQTATATPALHEFCRLMGWGWELNVPLMVDGQADGAICLLRTEDKPFTEADFSLAESLAKQIALAMQTSKIAEREKAFAIAREQEQAALQNAAELSKANEALRLAAERLDGLSDLDSFLDELVRAGAGIVGAAGGGIGLLEPDGKSLRIISFVSGTPVGGKLTGSLVQLEGPVLLAWNEILSAKGYWWAAPEHPGFTPEMRAMHESLGHRQIAHLALRIKDEVIGFIGLSFKTEMRPTESKLDLLHVLARQASVAVRLISLSSREKAAALAREREQAAQERAEELAKANDALQATVDATSQVLELDELVPKVLGIIANVFETDHCSIYENLPSGEVRLWYWHAEGRTLLPAELLRLDEEKYSLIRKLAAGFFVPPDYLGQDARIAGTVSLDHFQGTSVPEFDQWAISLGLDLELNIGIASQGVRCATLCVYRSHEHPFSPREIILAEALARQIGLALQVTKVSQTNLEAAVAREREQAARQRADELAKANGLLRRVNERLAHETNYRAVLGLLLSEITELVGNDGAAIYTYDEDLQALRFLMAFENGKIVGELVGHAYGHPDRPAEVRLFPAWPELVRSRSQHFVRMSPDSSTPPSNTWHHARGHRLLVQTALVANGQPLGLLGLAFTSDEPIDTSRIELFNAVAQQATLALQLSRQAERAEQAVVARERAQVAEQRAVDLAKSNRALQESIDSLGAIQDLEDFVPQVLKVITRTFGAISSGFFEHRADEIIFLRYWLFEGKVLNPGDLLKIDPVRFDLVKQLAKGFTAPIEYLGTTSRNRTKAVMIDHKAGTCVPEFDTYALTLGWAVELNVPIVVNGIAEGAITIYRGENRTFDEGEVLLAETLAKQMAIAMEASRLSTQARLKAVEIAVAHEKEQAAKDRAAELSKTNLVLRRGIDQLANSGDIETLLASSLAEAVSVSGANTGALFIRTGNGLEIILRSHFPAAPPALLHAIAINYPKASELHQNGHLADMLSREFTMVDLQEKMAGGMPPAVADYHASQGHQVGWHLTLRVGGRTIGFVALAFKQPTMPSDAVRETLNAITQQMAMALELTRLGEDAKILAVTKERELAAENRAEELAKANEAMRACLDEIAEAQTLDELRPRLLGTMIRLLGAVGGSLWLYDASDGSVSLELEYAGGKFLTQQESGFSHAPKHFFLPSHEASYAKHLRLIAGEALRMEVATSDMFVENEREHLLAQGVGTLVVLPMTAAGRHLGRLALAFAGTRELTATEWELAKTLANQTGLIVETTRLARQNRDKAEQTAKLEERNRLAREIHDTIAQGLTGVISQLEVVEESLPPEQTQIVTRVSKAKEIAKSSLVEARRSVWALHPPELDGCGLLAGLEKLAGNSSPENGTDCEFKIEGEPFPIPFEFELDLYRIAHEAVRNAIKHSGASRIHVIAQFDDEQFCMRITDNGNGIKESKASQASSSFGLISMRERAERCGGTLKITSAPDEGTEVVVCVARKNLLS